MAAILSQPQWVKCDIGSLKLYACNEHWLVNRAHKYVYMLKFLAKFDVDSTEIFLFSKLNALV